jgi:hypothetical protein
MRYRLMATYRGVLYEAGVGPTDKDVVLFAALPPPEELGFQPATGHWRKAVSRAEVDAVWESRPSGTFGGEPCLVLDDLDEHLHISYRGHDLSLAERLGYSQIEPGVFEMLAAREDVTGITEDRVDHPFLPLQRTWALATADPEVASLGAASPEVPLAAEPGPAGAYPESWAPAPYAEPAAGAGTADAYEGPGPDVAYVEPTTEPGPADAYPEPGAADRYGEPTTQPGAPISRAEPSAEPGAADPYVEPTTQPSAPISRAEPSAEPGPAISSTEPDPEPGTAIAFPARAVAEPIPAATPLGANLSPAAQPEVAAVIPRHSTRQGRAAARPRRAQTWQVFAELADLAAIPRDAYAIDEAVDGAICLASTDGGFEVFSAADGVRQEVRLFRDEETAYFYLFGLLAAEAVRDGRLTPLT